MPKDEQELKAPTANGAIESGGLQPSAELFGNQSQQVVWSEASAFGDEHPSLEPFAENTALSEDASPPVSEGAEPQPDSGTNGATSSPSGASDRKLAANRENAKRSTGPKSQEGKELALKIRTNTGSSPPVWSAEAKWSNMIGIYLKQL